MRAARISGALVAISLLAAMAPLLAGCASSSPPTVRLDSGPISGFERSGVNTYLGIPYAAAPVGSLRWKAPQAVTPWGAVRECRVFGSDPAQPDVIAADGTVTKVKGSEDCLYLNVWAPVARDPEAKKLPVMVWIYGGAFSLGSSSMKYFDGRHLAAKDVVVMSFNYRLGALGFLAHPALSAESSHGTSGNYGLLDQIAALKWVRANIGAFGGDPGNVTIFGESAGAISVLELMVSPEAKGLFHKAISESGLFRDTGLLMKAADTREDAYATGREFAAALDCDGAADVAAAMRSQSVSRIFSFSPETKGPFIPTVRFVPVIDGRVLTGQPARLFARGLQHDVPLIVGSNASEGNLFTANTAKLPAPPPTQEQYRKEIGRLYGRFAPEVLRMYPAAGASTNPTISRLYTAMCFTSAARFAAASVTAKGPKAYLYRFSRYPPRFKLGACHGIEIPYVFGTLVDNPKLGQDDISALKLSALSAKQSVIDAFVATFDRKDQEASRAMMGYWTNFAKDGDPNGQGLPVWPAFEPQSRPYMDVGDSIVAGTDLDAQACDLADKVWEAGLPR